MENKVLFLNQTDIKNCGGMEIDIYLNAVREALILHSNGDYVQPLKPYVRRKSNYHVADRIIAMPSYLGGTFNIFGLKWIGSNPTNRQFSLPRAIGTIILNDPVTKFPIAFMDGTIISAMRTAAVSGLAVEALAKKNSKVLGLIGLGIICKLQLQAILRAAPTIEQIRVYDIDKATEKKFVNFAKSATGRNIIAVADVKDIFPDADIVVTSTTASKGYIEGEWIQHGLLFINVSIMDAKPGVVLKADKIIVDDWKQCNREDKLLNIMYKQGLLSDDSIHAELGDLLAAKTPGRETDQEIIFFNPMGMSIEDIAAAYRIYQQALKSGIGTPLELFAENSLPVWL